MHIGIDFDNTIVCYDGIFHQLAVEKGLIPSELETDKTTVRDYLRKIDQEKDWSILQGYVYSHGMKHVQPFPSVVDAIKQLMQSGVDVSIISHKTQTPYEGPPYKLHDAAKEWISTHIPFHNELNVFFETTLEKKMARIESQKCHYFIDDLPEFLSHSLFPHETFGILFNPCGHSDTLWKGPVMKHWNELNSYICLKH